MSALPQKRTLAERIGMSALCQKQTFCAAVKNILIRSRHRRVAASNSPFWILCENVILCRHYRVACEPAVGTTWIKSIHANEVW